jgi:hypothetical protein
LILELLVMRAYSHTGARTGLAQEGIDPTFALLTGITLLSWVIVRPKSCLFRRHAFSV